MSSKWSDREKVALVEAYLNQSTMRLEKVARAHGLVPPLMRSWLRAYGAGQLGVQPRVFVHVSLDAAWLEEIDRRRGEESVAAWLGRILARETGLLDSLVSDQSPRPIRDLNLEHLPRGEPGRRWTPERRTALVTAILAGRLERVEACQDYGLEPDELEQWIERHRLIDRKQCVLVLETALWERLRKRCPREPGQRVPDRLVIFIRQLVAAELGTFAEPHPRAVKDFRPYGARKGPRKAADHEPSGGLIQDTLGGHFE